MRAKVRTNDYVSEIILCTYYVLLSLPIYASMGSFINGKINLGV